MPFHGNSYRNEKPHLLYVIYDKETGGVDKYGITDDPLEEDGLSGRIREQLDLFNRIAGWQRFYAEVLMTGIPGRRKAREIETSHIKAFFKEHGHKPPGNKAF